MLHSQGEGPSHVYTKNKIIVYIKDPMSTFFDKSYSVGTKIRVTQLALREDLMAGDIKAQRWHIYNSVQFKNFNYPTRGSFVVIMAGL